MNPDGYRSCTAENGSKNGSENGHNKNGHSHDSASVHKKLNGQSNCHTTQNGVTNNLCSNVKFQNGH